MFGKFVTDCVPTDMFHECLYIVFPKMFHFNEISCQHFKSQIEIKKVSEYGPRVRNRKHLNLKIEA